MKKITSYIASVALLITLSAAGLQAQSFAKGQKDLNIGIGFGNSFYNLSGGSSLPVFSASFDYGVADAISVGGYVGYTAAKWKYSYADFCNGNGYAYGNWGNYTQTDKWSFIIIGARGAYHFAQFIKNDKIDLYAGLMLGYNISHYGYTTTDPCPDYVAASVSSYGGFAWSIYAGGRYRFTPHVGAFLELGYGIAYANLGINFKF